MDEHHLRRIRIRRGTNSQRKSVLLEEGEFVYANDIKRVYVGDEETFGGNKVSNKNNVIDTLSKINEFDVGDLIYNKSDKSTYIVDNKNNFKKIIYSSDSTYTTLKKIDEVRLLLSKLEKICCSTDLALVTDDNEIIIADYGDWIKIKDIDIDTIDFEDCKNPLISKKYLNLQSNKIYTLNIEDINSSPDIIFLNNEKDEDANTPKQSIKIVENSVNSSNNIQILEVTDNTIKFKTNEIGIGITSQLGTFIDYDIENECGSKQLEDPTVSGIVYNSLVNINTVNIDEYITHISDKVYTMYKLVENSTKQYPWNFGAWFVFYFDGLALSDNYYITEVDRLPKLINGNWNIGQRCFGPIGPINGSGIFVFWHPENYDLNIWNQGFGSNTWTCFPLFNTLKHFNDPEYYFKDENQMPTENQIKTCLNVKGITKYQDYTKVYTGTQIPPFLAII
jgi:hypothetical protein